MNAAGSARRGIALLDLTMAVLIVGILAAVATPRFFATLDSHRSLAAARKVAADLQYARQCALSGSREQVVRFTLSSSTYTMDGIPESGKASSVWTVRLSESPWLSTVSSMTAGNSGVLRFNHLGLPDRAGSIVVARGGSQRTVSIDGSTGKAAVQ